jgi:hypothetical protein
MKKKLTQNEEFQIMILVLDKFLLLGFAILAFGLYNMFMVSLASGLLLIVAGSFILLLFMVLLVKEYEIIK